MIHRWVLLQNYVVQLPLLPLTAGLQTASIDRTISITIHNVWLSIRELSFAKFKIRGRVYTGPIQTVHGYIGSMRCKRIRDVFHQLSQFYPEWEAHILKEIVEVVNSVRALWCFDQYYIRWP